jgi:glyoxylase-like metal-dependent hydrolase (beta-lactamase superfamily II)
VTGDGSIVALPTPGHSPGHTSYLVRRKDGDVLLAGDVTYDLSALEAQRDQGFIADITAHRKTLDRVLALVMSGVAYLPSHDPASPSRLRHDLVPSHAAVSSAVRLANGSVPASDSAL